MFTAECPSCGAKVSLRASQSTTAVCGFCKSTLVRDAEALKRIGVQGELLEDYSRVQIGTGGRFEGRGFTVVGRIQLRYTDGGWNEWYVLYDDGSTGWFSEASGQYALTLDRGPAPGVPTFDALKPGMTAAVKGERYTVTDKRVAQCTAGEGELPFPVDSRWEARVVDLRSGDKLITLDWSAGETATLYAGSAVALESLSPTLLRSAAAVEETAGAIEGGLLQLECPSCGASVRYVPKLATHVTCRQCKSELAGKPEGLVLEVQRADSSERSTWLQLGDEGTFDGERYTVIGALARAVDDDPSSEWFEFLLYSPKQGFRWIVQAEGRFQWVEVLNELPDEAGGGARVGDQRFNRREMYGAVNTWVAGSFNWRPRVGDRVTVTEFDRVSGSSRTVLSREQSESELTWSRAVDLPVATLSTAFGKTSGPSAAARAGAGAAAAAGATLAARAGRTVRDLAWIFSVALAVFCLPAVFVGEIDDLVAPLFIAYLALWLPLRFESKDD
jgi:ribosomal protein S27E